MSLEKKEVMSIRNVQWTGNKDRKERRTTIVKRKLILVPILILALIAVLITPAIGCVGEQGPAGSQGKQGIQGEQGEQGEQGIQGKQGLTGKQGEAGIQGVAGSAGAKGATGSTGAQGIQGEEGPRGSSGAKGATGPTGPQGPAGSTVAPRFSVSLGVTGQASAILDATQARVDPYSIHLQTTSAPTTGDEARIIITPFKPIALTQLTSIYWFEYLSAGYPPHVDISLDYDGDGLTDDALVVEYAYNPMSHYAENGSLMPYGALTGGWYPTFSDDTPAPIAVDDTSYAWLASGAPGPPIPAGGTALGHTGGTLAQWKDGTILGSIDGDALVTKIEIEVDNWVLQTDAYVDFIIINNILVWW